MKVIVFSGSLRLGGAESMSIELANALADVGAEIWYAAAPGPLRDNIGSRVEWLSMSNANRVPFRAAGEFSEHLRTIRPDVVHSHGVTCSVVATMATRRASKRPLRVLTHHSQSFWRRPAPVGAWFMRRASDHYIAISTDKRAALERIGIPSERITLIPNFVDVAAVAERVESVDRAAMREALRISREAVVITMAGRVIPAKGFDRFVRIISLAADSVESDVHGIALGDGPALGQVRDLAASIGAGATFHFPGYQSDIFPYLAISDLILFPTSHPEVLPMFLIEAAAAGLPVVCSDIPGNRDIVEADTNGFLVRGSDEAYATRVTQLLADSGQRARMGQASRGIAMEHFDKGRVVRQVTGLYDTLLSSNKL